MKPFFIATTIEDNIDKAWVNREKTIVAVMRVSGASKAELEQRMRQLFSANNLAGHLISDEQEISTLINSLKLKHNWLKDTEAGE
jgi:hypothetical protein